MQESSEMWPDNKKLNKESLQKFIIILIGTGVVSLTAYSPLGIVVLGKTILRLLEQKADSKLKAHYSEAAIRRSLYRLKKNKYIRQANIKNGNKITTELKLTKEGKELMRGYDFYDLGIISPKKWDGKWRFVIYDIPESSINTRNIFRDKLKKMKFFMVQRSVWVYPYPCKKEMEFIIEFLGLQNSVLLFKANIKSDKRLKVHFRRWGFKL